MGVREILQHPDPRLSQVCEDATEGEDFELLVDLVETMMAHKGMGLAAPQIGVLKRAFAVHDPKTATVYALLNPRFVRKSHFKVWSYERCLSFAGVKDRTKVERSVSCTVEGISGHGKVVRIEAKDDLALAVQHEMDHLGGITISKWRQ